MSISVLISISLCLYLLLCVAVKNDSRNRSEKDIYFNTRFLGLPFNLLRALLSNRMAVMASRRRNRFSRQSKPLNDDLMREKSELVEEHDMSGD